MTALGSLLFLVVGLAGVLVLSAVAKWRDPVGSLAAVRAFRAPVSVAPVVAAALPFVEIALALGLLLLPGILFAVVAWLTVTLFVAFTLLVSVTLARGEAPACHCFGELSSEPIGRGTIARNTVLTVVALVVALVFGDWRWPSFVGALASLSGDALYVLLLLSAGGALLTLLWARGQRAAAALARHEEELRLLRAQFDSLAAGGVGSPGGATAGGVGRGATTAGGEEPDRSTGAIPALTLRAADGSSVALRELPHERAQLLVFVSPDCGACHDVVPLLPTWIAEFEGIIEVRLVSVGEPEYTAEAFGDATIELFDRERAVLTAVGALGTPSAVLLGTNGTIGGGPANGLPEITDFTASLVEAIALNRSQATPMPEGRPGEQRVATPIAAPIAAAPSTVQAGWVGEPVPDALVTAADGTTIDLATATRTTGAEPGTRLALVFWRVDCDYCASIRSEVAAASAAGSAVLVTTSEPDAVRAQGMTGTVLVSEDRAAMTAMAVPGTPVGFAVVDGVVADGPYIGADAVRDLVLRATA